MRNIKAQLAIGIVCIVLGVVLALQFRTIQSNLEGAAPAQKAEELVAELKKIREEKENLINEVSSLEGKIKEIEEAESKKSVLVKNMSEELEKYKIISGLRKVKGPGVVVIIDDPPINPEFSTGSVIMYNSDLLLSVINKLNDAGAEAISINDQRYVSRTEINLAGSNVNINSVPTAPPFVIKAIGNPDTLEATLNIRFGIVDYLKSQYNLQVAVKKQDEVIIPRYNEVIKFRYAKPVEDVE
ncbi:DUF881 domain-containing protein [Marinisporobacter balticus]|uniref:Uncharacterized protein YlxW (UPF0749 family) n=1 Tax=Marinisporobacter balticus TaxID=2018667 RepID=A0A4R2L5I9_9FIRM|nr:DUF881 domain-containing protein [Marinisporobacter balticus]TCO79299.1 uncharacterized protein YlxW (UPF0749 family) [Marinisporobacter balticus]